MPPTEPLATIRPSPVAVVAALAFAAGILAYGGLGIRIATYDDLRLDWIGVATSVTALLALFALPFLFRLQVGLTAKLYPTRLHLQPPYEPARVIDTDQILGWGHDYVDVGNEYAAQPRYEVTGILLFTTRGTIALGGRATTGELDMRTALAERFPFCELEGYGGPTDYPLGTTRQRGLLSPANELKLRGLLLRSGAAASLLAGVCLLVLPAWQRWSGPAPTLPALRAVRGTLSADPRVIFGGPARPNALLLRLDDPADLVFALNTHELAAADQSAVRRMRAGDEIAVHAYADELDPDASAFDYQQLRGTSDRSAYESGRLTVYPTIIGAEGKPIFERPSRATPTRQPSVLAVGALALLGLLLFPLGVRLLRAAGPLREAPPSYKPRRLDSF